MKKAAMIEPNAIYHIYNQGNNREKVFFQERNYTYFLEKVKVQIQKHADILSYCLMPNHYHFLVHTKESAAKTVKVGSVEMPEILNAIRNFQSTYTKGINKQESRSGALFRPKAKLKIVESADENYPFIAFHYIHQNPLKAGLVSKLEDWPYSSFNEYYKGIEGICNTMLAQEIIDFGNEDFYEQSYAIIY
ncbi:MAG: transposase [Bacteroidia bacterium]